jgi:hypothetical protein
MAASPRSTNAQEVTMTDGELLKFEGWLREHLSKQKGRLRR